MERVQSEKKILTGVIFDIKRFAVHDGPGIRSTLFLKGCPLRCIWCHNPEGLAANMKLWYFSSKCIGCRLCLEACPQNALSVAAENDSKIIIDSNACDSCGSCGSCVRICPSGALEFDGRAAHVDQIIPELLQDRSFFDESGGGVTLSGGDPVFQPLFTAEVLKRLKKEQVHTAIESSLFCSREVLETLMPVVDLFIADFKLFSEESHIKYTGVSNAGILSNIVFLLKSGADMLIRIPLIPGITAEDENIHNIAGFLSSSGCRVKCEFLNYNPLAVNKYRLRNIDTTELEGLKPLSNSDIERLESIMASYGIEVIFEK